jgi:hypothetical protein
MGRGVDVKGGRIQGDMWLSARLLRHTTNIQLDNERIKGICKKKRN